MSAFVPVLLLLIPLPLPLLLLLDSFGSLVRGEVAAEEGPDELPDELEGVSFLVSIFF
jgi:hypothetical protein